MRYLRKFFAHGRKNIMLIELSGKDFTEVPLGFMKKEKKLRQRWRQPSPASVGSGRTIRENSPGCGGVVVDRGGPGSPLLYIMLIAAQTHADDFCRKRSQLFKS